MKIYELSEMKKTFRNKDPYPDIPNSNMQASSRDYVTPTESLYLSRWGANIGTTNTSKSQHEPWMNVGQGIHTTSVGEKHALIINNQNECFAIGGNSYGQLGLENEETIFRPTLIPSLRDMKITKVICGAYHSFVLNSKGEVYAFGLNMKGQLGIGSYDNKKKPTLVTSLLPMGSKNPKSNWIREHSYSRKKIRTHDDNS